MCLCLELLFLKKIYCIFYIDWLLIFPVTIFNWYAGIFTHSIIHNVIKIIIIEYYFTILYYTVLFLKYLFATVNLILYLFWMLFKSTLLVDIDILFLFFYGTNFFFCWCFWIILYIYIYIYITRKVCIFISF